MRKLLTSNDYRHILAMAATTICLMAGTVLHGQDSYNMVDDDTLYINPCLSPTGVIYDDGGATGEYSNNFDGWAVITVPSGVTITLGGDYVTESSYDKITVSDGLGTNATTLVNAVSGTGSINVQSGTGCMVVYFHTDGSITKGGFALTYSIDGMGGTCSNTVSSLAVTGITTTSATLDWTADEPSGPFTVMVNGTAQTVTATTLALSGLNPNSHYDIQVFGQSDAGKACCKAQTWFRTLCGEMQTPMVETFDDYGTGVDVMPTCWVRLSNFDDDQNQPQIVATPHTSAPGTLRMHCGSDNVQGHFALAIGPKIADDISTLNLRLKIRSGYSGAKLEVGVCNDTTLYDNNFTPVDTITASSANTWQEALVSLAAYNGTGHRIAFRMIRSLQPSNGLSVFIDDMSVEPCGVWHLALQRRGIDDLWVAWDTIGEASVTLEYGVSGFTPGSGTSVSGATSPYHITELQPGASYDIVLTPSCTGAASPQRATLTAATLTRYAVPLTYCMDFEGMGTSWPEGWRRPTKYDNTPRNQESSGTHRLQFSYYSNNGTHPLAVMPRIDTVDIGALTVSFNAWFDNSSGIIEVGVMEYPEDPASFTPVAQVTGTNAWQRKAVSMADYTGNGRYIAFRITSSGYHSSYVYLDDLRVSTGLLGGVTVTNIAPHSVELRWDTVPAGFACDSVTVEYGTSGFTPGEGTIMRVPLSEPTLAIVGGKQSVAIGGLEADSDYQFRIYPTCDAVANHCDAVTLSAHTLMQDIELPYCVNFEQYANDGFPAEWHRPSTYGDTPRVLQNGYNQHSGIQYMEMKSYNGLEKHSTFVLPLLETDSVRGLVVNYFTWSNVNGTDYIQVGVMDDPTDEGTFTPVSTQICKYNQWQSHVASLEDYTGTGRYIAMRYYCNDYWTSGNLALDDIVVSDAGASERTVASVTSHGATLSWNPCGRGYAGAEIEWGPQGFQRSTGTRDTVPYGTYTYTLDTLQGGTAYDVYITAISATEATSCNYNYTRFTTSDQLFAANWCYGFDDVNDGGYPPLWTRPITYNSTPSVYANYSHTGGKTLRFDCDYNNGSHQSHAVLPLLEEESLDGITLRFYASGDGGYYSSNCRLVCGMMTSPTDTSTFIPLATFTINQYEWHPYSVDLGAYEGEGRHIAFRYYGLPSYSYGTVYLDDLTIERCRITGVRSYSPTTSTVTIGWDAPTGVDSVDVAYGTDGWDTVVTNATSPLTLTDLLPGTTYTYSVQPHCTGSPNTCSDETRTFATIANATGDGWCEDFETYGYYQRPTGWTSIGTYGDHPMVWLHDDSQYYTSYHSAFEFKDDGNHPNLVVLPAVEEAIDDLTLTLNLRCSDPNHPERPTLIVGVMTLPYDTTTFVPVDTLRPTYNYRTSTVSFASYAGTGRHIAFLYMDDGNRYAYIDDLRLSRCAIADLRTLNLTDHSVRLQWTTLGPTTGTTLIEYDTTGFTPGNGLRLRVAGNSADIADLIAERSYDFYIYAPCQDTTLTCQATRLNIATLATPMEPPACFGFESHGEHEVPNGFTITGHYGGVRADFGHLSAHSVSLASHNSDQNGVMPTFLALPPMQDGLSGVYADFWLYADNEGSTWQIGTMSDPYDTSTFTPLDTYIVGTRWQHHHCTMAALNSTDRTIAFRFITAPGTSGNGYIDDITLRSCAMATWRAYHPTYGSLDLSWTTTGADSIVVEYKAVGALGQDFTPGSGTTLHLASSPATVTGLQDATYYTFHFYPICDGAFDGCNYEMAWNQTLHPPVDFPYCENFDGYGYGSFMDNWRSISTQDYSPVTTGDDRSTCLQFAATDTTYSIAAMPALAETEDNSCPDIYVNLWAKFPTNSAKGRLLVGTMTDIDDATTFIPAATISVDTSLAGDWQPATVLLAGFRNSYPLVAFRFVSDSGMATCIIDDICIEHCVASEVHLSAITQNSVTVSWEGHGVDSLFCEYGYRGFEPGTGDTVVITTSPFIIDGLSSSSEYDFNFSGMCGCNLTGPVYPQGGGSGGSGGTYYGWYGWYHGGWSHTWWWYYFGGSGGSGYYFPTDYQIVTQSELLPVPYCEDFEYYDVFALRPVTRSYGVETDTAIHYHDTIISHPSWKRISGSSSLFPHNSGQISNRGDTCLVFYAQPGTRNYAALPPVEEGTASDMVMSFYAQAPNGSAVGDNARFIVGVMTDPDDGTTFVPVDTVRLSEVNRWEQHTVNFASYTGTGVYLAFCFAPYGGAYHFYIDDLYVGRCAVDSIRLVASDSDVQVFWHPWGSPAHVDIEYGEVGFTPGTGTSLSFDATCPVTLTDLDPTQSYDLYVTSRCDDTSAASCKLMPVMLNPVLSMPYCDDFEHYNCEPWPGPLPDMWKVVNRSEYRTEYPCVEYNPTYADNLVAFYGGPGNRCNMVLLPPLPQGDTLNGKYVHVRMSSLDKNRTSLEFGYMTDTANYATFVSMGMLRNTANDRVEDLCIQLDGSGGANRLAIRQTTDYGDYWIRLLNLVVSDHPYPTNVRSTMDGPASQRRIEWDNTLGVASYTIEYGARGETTSRMASDSCGVTLTGLSDDTDYEVYFVTPAGKRLCMPYTFHTSPYMPLPYCDDYGGYDYGTLPEGWLRHHSRSNQDYPRVTYNHEIQFYGYGGDVCQLTLPDMGLDDMGNLDIKLDMYSDNNNSGLAIGIMTDPTDPTTFQAVDTLTNSALSTWQRRHLTLNRYEGTGHYLTFRLVNTTSSWKSVYIDNVEVSACAQPTITAVGSNTVRLTLPDGVEADYYVRYTPAPQSSAIHVTENPFHITGLMADSSYSFSTMCDTTATACAAPTVVVMPHGLPLPHCDDFDQYDDYVVPTGWHSYSSHGDNYPRTYYSCYNSCCKTMDFYCDKNHLQYTALPDLGIDSVRHVELYFSLRIEDVGRTKLIVGVMDDRADFATFTPVDTLVTPSSGTHYPQHVSLVSYQGSGRYVAFRILTTYNWRTSIFIDDLRISPYPSPSLALTDATTVTATSSRHEGVDYWIEYGESGFTPMNGDGTWLHITSDTMAISGLTENTTYDFYHYADSMSGTCFPKTTMTTSTHKALPYCDNFNQYSNYGGNVFPDGWGRYHTDNYHNTNDRYPRIQYWSGNDRVLQFYCNRDNRCYAVMPEIDVDNIADINLSLWLYSDDHRYEGLIVGVMSDMNDFGTFVPVDTLFNTVSGTGQTLTTSLSGYAGDGRFLAFRQYNTSNNSSWRNIYVDVLRIQSCPRPTVQLVGGTMVRFDVDTNLTPDYWIEYGPQGITQLAVDSVLGEGGFVVVPHNIIVHVTESPFFIDSLADNTTYDFHLRCDSAVASCAEPARIATSTKVAVPYCENFDGTATGQFPIAWRRTNGYNSSYPIVSDMGGRCLEFYTNSSYPEYAVLPEMGVDSIGGLTISFSMYASYASQTTLVVGVMESMDDYGGFDAVDTLRCSANSTWERFTVSLAGHEGRFIAFRHDVGSSSRSLYIDDLSVDDCHIPNNASATLHGHNVVRISAAAQSATGFYVEYGATGFAQGEGTLFHVDTLPLDLELENNASYDFHFRCDSVTPSCLPAQTVVTLGAPLDAPHCEDFEGYAVGTIPEGWRAMPGNDYYNTIGAVGDQPSAVSGQRCLRLYNRYSNDVNYVVLPDVAVDSLSGLAVTFHLKGDASSTVALGVMSDPYDASSFLPVKSFRCDNEWRRCQALLADLPGDARFIAFRQTASSSYSNAYVDNVGISLCGVSGMRVTETESDHIGLDWTQVGEPTITIEYGPIGFERGSGTTLSPTHPPFTVEGLDNLTNYMIYFDATCGEADECDASYHDSVTVFTPAGGTGCIDHTSLTADYTTCFWGSYANPYEHTGIVDHGSANPDSRHTVCYDTSARDSRTAGLLRTIPQGENASVRLGNWGSGGSGHAEGEAITYSLYVDSNSFDLLILKYAAVLQDPLHAAEDQPRFSLEVLDSNMNLVDPTCGAANFIADRNLGWNMADDNVLWKDWTTVGVDMSQYAGQTVYVRLTTRDCGEGNHYGYAYFSLDCMLKNMRSELCGDVDSNRFYAPNGFAYRWYSDNHMDDTLSTEQSLKVATENISYYCDCSFIDNDECSFTISAFAGTRYPLADFNYSVEVSDCQFQVTFTNNSSVSLDGITPIESGEPCESAEWDFGNDDGATTYNATATYTNPGTYTVRLVSGLANNACTDTAELDITLAFSPIARSIMAPDGLCLGDTARVTVDGHYTSLSWSNNSTDSMLTLVPDADTTLTCYVTDSSGCVDTLRHTVSVHPHHSILDTVGVCEDMLPYSWADTTVLGGDHLRAFTSTFGCDSTMQLHLNVGEPFAQADTVTICAELLPYTWQDTAIALFDGLDDGTPHDFTLSRLTAYGCDSVHTLNLTVNASTDTAIYDTIMENSLPYLFNDVTYVGDTIDTLVLVNAAGCDSTLRYSLFVLRNVTATADSAVCDDMLPLTWNARTFTEAGTQLDTLVSTIGTDSVVEMTLTVWSTYDIADTQVVCRNALPHTWADTAFAEGTASGDYSLMRTSTHGCDSLMRLHLVMGEPFSQADTATLCADLLPYTWQDTAIALTDGLDDGTPHNFTLSRLTTLGCDSTYTLNLTVNPVYDLPDTVVICQNSLPLTWRDTSFAEGTASGDHGLARTSAFGCDSVMRLHLTVDTNTSADVHEYIVENDLPYAYNGYTLFTDTVGDTIVLANAKGCDSVVNYSLTVHRNVFTSADSTVCDDLLPLAWNARTFTEAGTQLDTLAAATGADSVVTMTLAVNATYRHDDTVILCRNAMPYSWIDTSFAVSSTGGHYTRSYLSVDGCDSVHTLTLTVNDTFDVVDHIVSCEPITWADNNTYDQPITGPQAMLQTVDGCDSLTTLDFQFFETATTAIADSFCAGTVYHFAGYDLTEGGVYDDTLQTVDHCDSIVTLTLTRLEIPPITLDIVPDCFERAYDIALSTTVDYVHWSVDHGNWNYEWGSPDSSALRVAPTSPISFTVSVDYLPEPTCPNSRSVTIYPVKVPEGDIKVIPEQITYDEPTFTAFDRSVNAVGREWWVDGAYYGDTPSIECTPSTDGDTVRLVMVAVGDMCNDTVLRLLPVYRDAIVAPNVFTPDKDENNLFRLAMMGIHTYEIVIYTRSGNQIFHSLDPDEGWDGTYNGTPMPQGAYVWLVKYTTEQSPNRHQMMKGTVLLLR